MAGRKRPGSTRRPGGSKAQRTGLAPGLRGLVGQQVVLDTAGPIVYLGRLAEVRADGYWLEAADLRDGREGHVTKERYICEAREQGVRANRRRIFVFAHVVISASALSDVVTEYPADNAP